MKCFSEEWVLSRLELLEKIREEEDECGLNEGKPVYKCPLCGRRVSKECFDEKHGICMVCLATLCRLCGSRYSVATCQLCGRNICRECTYLINDVRPVCKSCIKKHGYNGVRKIIEEEIVRENKNLYELLH